MQGYGLFDAIKQFTHSFPSGTTTQTSSHEINSQATPPSPSSIRPMSSSPISQSVIYTPESITASLKHVCITIPGPMYIRLRMDEALEVAKVTGFEKGSNGQISEVEKDGRVKLGDVLIAVNFTTLFKRSFDDIIVIIKNQPEPSPQAPKVLTFCTKSKYLEFLKEAPLQLSMALSMEKKKPQTNVSIYHNYVKEFQSIVLTGGRIDEMELRKFSMMGLPDGNQGIRSMIWKILLGYLPLDTSTWTSHLESQRALYKSLLSEVTSMPSHSIDTLSSSLQDSLRSAPPRGNRLRTQLNPIEFHGVGDHPLHVDGNISTWARYWSDSLVVDSIQKDVIRTYPDLHFFLEREGECQTSLQNILFLYAKLNPGIKYVQGMNELVGTLYYVFANDQNSPEWVENAEADSFFCFSLMMGEIRDMYIHNMDEASTGISGRIQKFVDTLRWYDEELCNHLLLLGIEPSFYSLRWMTTIFSREFDVLDTIRLWDSYLAETSRDEFITYMCCAMVLDQREQLLKGDFGENLSLLQRYPPTDVTYLLRKAHVLRYHDTSGTARPSKEDSRSDYLENTVAKSLIHTANTRSLVGGSQRSGSPSISTLTDAPNTPTGNNSSVFTVGLQEVFKASSSLTKLVTSSLFGPEESIAKPLTYYEPHHDDLDIANYVQEEDIDSATQDQDSRIDGEADVLDFQEDSSIPRPKPVTGSPSLRHRKTSSFLPLNKLKTSPITESPSSNSYCPEDDDSEDEKNT